MKSHTRVVVIGGGVIGCSVLYHLTRLGWTDVVLIERAELTAGSTWHAAGGMHTLNGDPNVAALQDYTIKLYAEIERESGVSCGIHRTGCLYLAVSDREVDFFKGERAKARYLRLALDFISLDEAKRLNPLIKTSDYRAAMFDPNDGHIDPSGVTNAYAQSARKAGAEIYRYSPVTSVRRLPSGEWNVETPDGSVRCEYVVNAGGLWAREVGRLMGYELPIVPMEHQYIVTNDVPALSALEREIPAAVDFDGAAYLRQEGYGLLLGTYEHDCRHWATSGTPPDFGQELLPPDLERVAAPLQKVVERMPALGEAGIKHIVNGGMVFAPDGNPVIGPLPGQPTAYVAAGVMAGFSQGGGVGLAVARWIVEGEPGMDVFAMDIARFGNFASRSYVLEKTRENYRRRFILQCPNEELEAGRPLRMTPIYDSMVASGALLGAAAGWEVPLWFADSVADAHESPSFRRTKAFTAIAEECRAVRQRVGLWDTSSYCKLSIRGRDAAAWLNQIVANQVPLPGRMALCPMLTPGGRILGDVSVTALGEDHLLLMGSPAAELVYLRWLHSQTVPSSVTVTSATSSYCGLSLTGPLSRDLLQSISSDDLSHDALPLLATREVNVGLTRAIAIRVSFTGELGYELYVVPEYHLHLYQTLTRAGRKFGMRQFGARALNSLRMEKGYGGWGREYTQDYSPVEAHLTRLVRTDKNIFVGRQAVLEQLKQPPSRTLRLLRIDSADPDPVGGEPVLHRGEALARLTSAAYAYTFGHSLGFAYLPAAIDSNAKGLEVELLGSRVPAMVLDAPLYDPSGKRIRS
jgi:dimethylglycine dehydrogenase